MLTFLRKIRRSLIESSSFGKPASPLGRYLLYAVGEIALVVIGILIALQINNWNEERKTQQQIEDHLENLAGDLNEDIAEYLHQYRHQHMRFHAFLYLLNLVGTPLNTYEPLPDLDKPKDEYQAMYPYPDTFHLEFVKFGFKWMGQGFVSTQVNRTAVEEIKNQGLFSQIRNAKLKKQINDYYKYIDWVFGEAIVINYQNQAQELGKYLRDQYGIINIDISDLVDPIGFLKQHKDVRLMLRSVIEHTYYHSLEMLRTKNKAEELIVAISNEISNG
jgi:hypothetical protein